MSSVCAMAWTCRTLCKRAAILPGQMRRFSSIFTVGKPIIVRPGQELGGGKKYGVSMGVASRLYSENKASYCIESLKMSIHVQTQIHMHRIAKT